jgi:3-hydroxy-3-methylglutaryl CoA synthase
LIKFEATINGEKVYLSLDVDDAEQPTMHQITGSVIAQKIFTKALYSSFDMYGHTIGASSPAIDVYHALFHTPDNKFLKAKIVNGMKYIDDWKAPTLPKNAVR